MAEDVRYTFDGQPLHKGNLTQWLAHLHDFGGGKVPLPVMSEDTKAGTCSWTLDFDHLDVNPLPMRSTIVWDPHGKFGRRWQVRFMQEKGGSPDTLVDRVQFSDRPERVIPLALYLSTGLPTGHRPSSSFSLPPVSVEPEEQHQQEELEPQQEPQQPQEERERDEKETPPEQEDLSPSYLTPPVSPRGTAKRSCDTGSTSEDTSTLHFHRDEEDGGFAKWGEWGELQAWKR